MKSIIQHINEKLIINKSIVGQQPGENKEVLVLMSNQQKLYTFERGLFVQALNDLYNKYKYKHIEVFVDYKNGQKQRWYSLYNVLGVRKNEVIMNKITRPCKFLTIVGFDSEDQSFYSYRATEKLINKFNEFNSDYKYFKIDGVDKYCADDYKWLYLWASHEDKCMKMYASFSDYETLRKKYIFQ